MAKRVLEAGVPVNKKTKEGITPIDYAIKNNQEEMIKFLKERGANNTDHLSNENKTETKDSDK